MPSRRLRSTYTIKGQDLNASGSSVFDLAAASASDTSTVWKARLDGATNEVQKFTTAAATTPGTLTIGLQGGINVTTATITPGNAASVATAIKTAIDGDTAASAVVDVTIGGINNDEVTLSYKGTLAKTDVANVTFTAGGGPPVFAAVPGAVSEVTKGNDGVGALATIETAVNSALNLYGNSNRQVDNQIAFNKDKLDALESGLGSLIDADLAKEAARLQALQIRQQLGATALSTANSAPQVLLSLFR